MNKSEFVTELAKSADISKALASTVYEKIFDENGILFTALKKGDKVAIPGFGNFEVRNTPARTARNPATGQSIQVPPRRKAVFKPLKGLKDALV